MKLTNPVAAFPSLFIHLFIYFPPPPIYFVCMCGHFLQLLLFRRSRNPFSAFLWRSTFELDYFCHDAINVAAATRRLGLLISMLRCKPFLSFFFFVTISFPFFFYYHFFSIHLREFLFLFGLARGRWTQWIATEGADKNTVTMKGRNWSCCGRELVC